MKLKRDNKFKKNVPFYVRWAVRLVCRHINKRGINGYEMWGEIHWNDVTTASVNVSRGQFINNILGECGYSHSENEINEIYNIK